MREARVGGDARPEAPAAPSLDDAPHPRRRIVFAVAAIGLFLASVDQTIVATALSAVQRDLHAPIQWSTWTLTAYSLGQVLIMPIAGKLSDIFGPKRIFLIAIIVFSAASLLCGLAPNIYVLVVMRVLQAIGGGAIMPSASGIVSELFGRERDRALAFLASTFPIGGVVGPVLGGVFVSYWSWRGIFFINVPLGVVLIALGLALFPRGARRPTARFDLLGVALLGVLILGTMLGITELGNGAGILSPAFIAPECVALVALVFFIRHTRRTDAPVIPPRLLIGHRAGVVNVINFVYGGAAVGFGALIPIYAEDRYGLSPLQSSTLLTARAVGMVCVAGLAAFALRRTGFRPPMLLGLSLVVAGLVLLYVPAPPGGEYVWLSFAAGVTGLGMGLALPAANNAALHRSGGLISGAAGLRGMLKQSGAIISVSVAASAAAAATSSGAALADACLVFAGIIVCVLPLVLFVPEHRGRW